MSGIDRSTCGAFPSTRRERCGSICSDKPLPRIAKRAGAVPGDRHGGHGEHRRVRRSERTRRPVPAGTAVVSCRRRIRRDVCAVANAASSVIRNRERGSAGVRLPQMDTRALRRWLSAGPAPGHPSPNLQQPGRLSESGAKRAGRRRHLALRSRPRPVARISCALKTWITFQTFGARRIGACIEHTCRVARRLETLIQQSDLFEMRAPVKLNIVCFGLKSMEDGALNSDIVLDLHDRGTAAPSTTLS